MKHPLAVAALYLTCGLVYATFCEIVDRDRRSEMLTLQARASLFIGTVLLWPVWGVGIVVRVIDD